MPCSLPLIDSCPLGGPPYPHLFYYYPTLGDIVPVLYSSPYLFPLVVENGRECQLKTLSLGKRKRLRHSPSLLPSSSLPIQFPFPKYYYYLGSRQVETRTGQDRQDRTGGGQWRKREKETSPSPLSIPSHPSPSLETCIQTLFLLVSHYYYYLEFLPPYPSGDSEQAVETRQTPAPLFITCRTGTPFDSLSLLPCSCLPFFPLGGGWRWR